MQQRGHEPSLSHASPSPAEGAGSPYLALGAVTKRCLATSPATVEGDLPSSDAIDRQLMPRSSILSIALRSCLSSLEYDLSDGDLPPLSFLAIPASCLSGAGPFRRHKTD